MLSDLDSNTRQWSTCNIHVAWLTKADIYHGDDYITSRALSSFESGDLTTARDYTESQSDGRHQSRDPEVFPLWDPGQLLVTSQTLLLKAATFQAGEDGSGSDDATSVTSDGDYGTRWA